MIRLHKVSKIYRPSKDVKVTALDNVSLEIKQGEFVAILGKSGSGKSTLMYIIGLLEKPTQGEVYIKNKLTSQMNDQQISSLRNETVGFIFQQFNLIPKLPIIENVVLPMVYRSKNQRAETTKYAEYLMGRFGILEKRGAFPNQLSGGQQQRVAIARALINKPEIIIADEPTGNLDSKTGAQIMDLLEEIHQKEAKTIILVTHDQQVAKRAKRQLYLEDGCLVKQ
jgi:putative ABC transport system ATP-binding protein